MAVNKPCALRTNLEGPDRRHPDAAAAARALGVGPGVHARRTLNGPVLPRATWNQPPTRTEGVDDLGDGDHRRVAMVTGSP